MYLPYHVLDSPTLNGPIRHDASGNLPHLHCSWVVDPSKTGRTEFDGLIWLLSEHHLKVKRASSSVQELLIVRPRKPQTKLPSSISPPPSRHQRWLRSWRISKFLLPLARAFRTCSLDRRSVDRLSSLRTVAFRLPRLSAV